MSAPQFDGPREMYNKYRAGLIAKGASTTEADRQMDIIERLMRERPDAYRAMFNNIYRTAIVVTASTRRICPAFQSDLAIVSSKRRMNTIKSHWSAP